VLNTQRSVGQPLIKLVNGQHPRNAFVIADPAQPIASRTIERGGQSGFIGDIGRTTSDRALRHGKGSKVDMMIMKPREQQAPCRFDQGLTRLQFERTDGSDPPLNDSYIADTSLPDFSTSD
jgi:hypothetical protein